MSLADREITRLISLLQEVDNDTSILLDPYSQMIGEIAQYATEYLTVGPEVHSYRDRLQRAGYVVYPGEVDGFGWLTAYFQMKRGVIVFG